MSLSDDDDDYLSADEDCLLAPPPTPALSSSFNTDEPNTWSPQANISSSPSLKINTTQQTTNNSTTTITPTPKTTTTTSSSSSPTITTLPSSLSANGPPSQYGWRIPTTTRVKQQGVSETKKVVELKQASDIKDDPRSEQTRLTLDRLSEKLSQYDKNLFEKVAEDIKKVSIKPKQDFLKSEKDSSQKSKDNQEDRDTNTTGIPIISDLSNTLGWGWEGASKFLASASQVTSQVAPLLDSVVSVPQQLLQQQEQKLQPTSSTSLSGELGISVENGDEKLDNSLLKARDPKNLEVNKGDQQKNNKDNPKIPPKDENSEPALNMEVISNLSNTLGWSWSGASKLLASASHELTSQVGSVLDSVVNAPQQNEEEKSDPTPVVTEEIVSEKEEKDELESFFYSRKGDSGEKIKSIKNVRKQASESNEL